MVSIRLPAPQKGLSLLGWTIITFAVIAALAIAAITFSRGSDATAQAPISVAPVAASAPAVQAQPPAAPLAQQASAPAAATSLQTVQLTPAQRDLLAKQLANVTNNAMPNRGEAPVARAENTLYNVTWGLRTKFGVLDTEIKSEVIGPITRGENSVNSARVRVNVTARTGPNTTKTAHKDITLYFVLDANNKLKQVVDVTHN